MQAMGMMYANYMGMQPGPMPGYRDGANAGLLTFAPRGLQDRPNQHDLLDFGNSPSQDPSRPPPPQEHGHSSNSLRLALPQQRIVLKSQAMLPGVASAAEKVGEEAPEDTEDEEDLDD